MTISIPVKGFSVASAPSGDASLPQKARFFVRIGDVPTNLTEWMSTNPREQNLGSSVAQAISASIRADTKDFHLKNRGVLMSAESMIFEADKDDKTARNGQATITFTDPALHGNVDGGHTLRLILAAQESDDVLPEQYVEFEVITGLTDLLPIAEARNTSVALDMKSMEAMKGSFDVLKSILGDCLIGGDRFFDRVELKMNEQLEEKNSIDIRHIIGILLMFNKTLFPNSPVKDYHSGPHTLFGKPEMALTRYLSLGDGDPEARRQEIEAMAPILLDILTLYDIIERELPLVAEKKYAKFPFATRRKTPKALFSNVDLLYTVPRSIVQPIVAGMRGFADIGQDGKYYWQSDPFECWASKKDSYLQTLMDSIKSQKNDPTRAAKFPFYWHGYAQIAELHRAGL